MTDERTAVDHLPTLPGEFWQARPTLGRIRAAARAVIRSPDAVLLCVLTRIASMLQPWLRADAGLGPAQLNTYLAIVGRSGLGKTSGYAVARRLVPIPAHLAGTDSDGNAIYVDGIGIGSGEGIAELYMGRIRDLDGKPVRKQVRHRALVVVDEGQLLVRVGERRGATTGAVLRSAWSGATLGTGNGSAETTRFVPAGMYSLGLITGWQMGTAQALLADTDSGMAQRFLWVSAADPLADENDVRVDLPLQPFAMPWPATPKDGMGEQIVRFPAAVEKELRARQAAVLRGEIVVDDQDTHEPLHRIRLAALMAVLDGRLDVTEEDWQLGETIWRNSCAVRTAVLEHGLREAERERDEREQQRLELAERTAAVVDVAPIRVKRVARRIGRYVLREGGCARAAARRHLAGSERGLFDAALVVAEERGWITVLDGGALAPGRSDPDADD